SLTHSPPDLAAGATTPGGFSATRARAQFQSSSVEPVEHQHASTGVDPDAVPGSESAFQDRLRERILDALLDRALERPGAENRVEARTRQLGQRAVGHLKPH